LCERQQVAPANSDQMQRPRAIRRLPSAHQEAIRSSTGRGMRPLVITTWIALAVGVEGLRLPASRPAAAQIARRRACVMSAATPGDGDDNDDDAAIGEAERSFRVWLERTAPVGAQPSESHVVTSEARTLEGALRDFWLQVVLASKPGAPPVTVLLLPECEWLRPWERFSAMEKHLQQCREVCGTFGGAIRAVPLHPNTEAEPTDAGASIADLREPMSTAEAERRRAPFPAFTLTSRVGPSIVRAPPLEGASADGDAAAAGGATLDVSVRGELVDAAIERFSAKKGEAEEVPGEAEDDEGDDEGDGEEPMLDDETLNAAKAALERQFRSEAPAADVPPAEAMAAEAAAEEAAKAAASKKAATVESSAQSSAGGPNAGATSAEATSKHVLEETMAWWEVYFSRVHKIFGHRQRRRVEASSGAEQVYATFWAEAALLAGDDSDARLCADLLVEVDQPEDAISSLMVLPGLGESEYREVRQTLALSLPFLGLTEDFSLSAFHPRVQQSRQPRRPLLAPLPAPLPPRSPPFWPWPPAWLAVPGSPFPSVGAVLCASQDTFEIKEGPDGRTWEMSLPFPLVHLVRKKNNARD
jgi:hypothetical protein